MMAIPITWEELESYIMHNLLEQFPDLERAPKDVKEKILGAIRVLIESGRPLAYAWGICGRLGSYTKQCIINATSMYTIGYLKPYIVRLLVGAS
ncbi:MAG: hypothetical protein ACPL3C_09150 [Pyrobaculum sp.]